MNIKPEWKKETEKVESNANTNLSTHANTADIHRKIHISTASPTNADGANGDIWITYEA